MEETKCVWQHSSCVLRCVFLWLPARELWRCGAVCRAWRSAALEPALWRRALRPAAPRDVLAAFAAAARVDEGSDGTNRWSWRREYALSAARWRRCLRLAAGRAPLLHATVTAPGDHPRRLAVLAEHGELSIWEQDVDENGNEDEKGEVSEENAGSVGSEWHETWACSMGAYGWRRAESARWAGGRLLLVGPVALSERWEAAILEQDETRWRVVCRAEAGAGGATCWAGGEAFLTLQLQLLAPGLAVTTAWLNAVSQESKSEYSGVRTPLLRIFNEAVAHVSHILMTAMPAVPVDAAAEVEPEDEGASEYQNENIGPTPEYYAAISAVGARSKYADQLLVVAMGAAGAGGRRGEARALAAWRVCSSRLRPPPILVGVPLADRVRQRREQALLTEEHEVPPPSEEEVRMLCAPPDDTCPLGAQVLGLALHPRGSCLWASTTHGATCVTLPTLRRVLRVPHDATSTPRHVLHIPHVMTPPHYVTPDVDDDYLVTPEGSGSGVVHTVACRSAQRGALLRHAAPVLVTLLAAPGALLVLATDALHKNSGNSRSATQGPRSSCIETPAVPCAPCERVASPPCRGAKQRTRPALRVTCCAPRRCEPPPCIPHEQQLTCLHTRIKEKNPKKSSRGCFGGSERCGMELDRVARRLAIAKSARRQHYEREVINVLPHRATASPAPPYRLVPERECVRATDGCDYTIAANMRPENKCPQCGPDRQPPAPQPIELSPSDACEPDRELQMDPCAHRPRVVLHVDRLPPEDKTNRQEPVLPLPPTVPRQKSSRERLTTRIMETLNLKRESKISCPKSTCKAHGTTKDNSNRCANLPKPETPPLRCREPSIVEQLKRRPGGSAGRKCGGSRQDSRQLHTSRLSHVRDKCQATLSTPPVPTIPATLEAKNHMNKGLEVELQQRSQLKEVARGRVVRPHSANDQLDSPAAGNLELRIPPSSESVRVRVSLDFMPLQTANCMSTAVDSDRNCKNIKRASSLRLSSDNGSWLSIRGIQKKWSDSRKHEKVPMPATPQSPRKNSNKSAIVKKADSGYRCPPSNNPRYSSAVECPQILC